MLRDLAEFEFWPVFARLYPTNPDGGKGCDPTRIVSDGPGPFDMSGAADDAAVKIKIKTDAGAWVTDTVDLSGASDITAVTVAELVTAINTAAVTNLTASAESGTGYLKLALTTPGSAKYLQVGDELAELTGIGFGLGMIIEKVDTSQSIAFARVMKDGENLEIAGADGKTTSVLTDGYITSATLTLTDTAYGSTLTAMIEGGVFETVAGYTNKVYRAPGSSTVKPMFTVEYFTGLFDKDTNQEQNIAGYVWRTFANCKGTVGDLAGDRNGQTTAYTITATPYRNPITEVKDNGPWTEQKLTLSEYKALNVLNV